MAEIPERWKNEAEVFWQPDSKVRQVLEELSAAEARIRELEQERDQIKKEASAIAVESITNYAQLHAQLQAVTQERNDAQNWLLDGVGGRAYLDSQIAQLQARNRKLVETLRKIVGVKTAISADMSLKTCQRLADAAVLEIDKTLETNQSGPAINGPLAQLAQLQARNRKMVVLCKQIAEDEGLNELIKGIGESPSWWKPLHAALADEEQP